MPGRGVPRLILFDLDGTLLAPGSVLRPRTLGALRAVLAHGATIALATGGFSYRARRLAQIIDGGAGRTWAITHNGAAIWDPSGALASSTTMPTETMRAVIELSGPRAWCVFEALDSTGGASIYSAGRGRRDLQHFIWGPSAPDEAPDMRPDALSLPGRDRIPARGAILGAVLGCWILGTPEALARVDRAVEGGALCGGRYLHWSQRMAHILGRPRLRIVGRDVGPLGMHKGVAARWLSDRTGIPPAQTAAFGDATNDVEMLSYAGTSVAMANATPDARAAASIVAPANTDDGVAHMLERWLQDGANLPDSVSTR